MNGRPSPAAFTNAEACEATKYVRRIDRLHGIEKYWGVTKWAPSKTMALKNGESPHRFIMFITHNKLLYTGLYR